MTNWINPSRDLKRVYSRRAKPLPNPSTAEQKAQAERLRIEQQERQAREAHAERKRRQNEQARNTAEQRAITEFNTAHPELNGGRRRARNTVMIERLKK